MTKVTFVFDKEKDLRNNHFAVNFVSPFEPKRKFNQFSPLDCCKGKKFGECSKIIGEFHKKLYDSPLIESVKDAFQNAWDIISEQFFKRLDDMTGKKFPFKEVKVYLTTQTLTPYDSKEGNYYVSIWNNISHALKTSGHELMHLHFHKYDWEGIENQLGKDKTNSLKEALTVLLNVEFKDLWFISDKGKANEKQQKLREFIKKEWIQEKNYNSLLLKCVNYLKNDI